MKTHILRILYKYLNKVTKPGLPFCILLFSLHISVFVSDSCAILRMQNNLPISQRNLLYHLHSKEAATRESWSQLGVCGIYHFQSLHFVCFFLARLILCMEWLSEHDNQTHIYSLVMWREATITFSFRVFLVLAIQMNAPHLTTMQLNIYNCVQSHFGDVKL